MAKYSNIFTGRVGDNGRITIPKAIIDTFKIKKGDIVTLALLEITKLSDIKVINISASRIDSDAAEYEDIISVEE